MNESESCRTYAFGVSFLQSQNSIIEFFTSLLKRSVEKRPIRLKLDLKIECHSRCDRLYMLYSLVYIIHERQKTIGVTASKMRAADKVQKLYCKQDERTFTRV